MKTFKRIYIEITNTCNLNCSFCPPSKRENMFMTLKDFEAILQKIKGHGQYVYLHIKGEPMLHPEFFKILDLCEDYGLKVNLTTNGTLIREHHDDLINAKALRQISISLQSQENLEALEDYTMYMNDVLRLIKEGVKKTEIIFELRLWNYQDIAASNGKNQLALALIMQQLNVSIETIEAIPQGKGTKLRTQVYLSKSVEFQWPDMKLNTFT